jgi:competence protein ComEA
MMEGDSGDVDEIVAALSEDQEDSSPSATSPPAASSSSASSQAAQPPPRTQQQPPDSRVDLNTATSEQLQTLDGVGPVTAQKIIDYRNAHGPFASVDDLLNVSGIGPKTLEKLKPSLRVQ